jgi:20S proteasome alpha/beta subunit
MTIIFIPQQAQQSLLLFLLLSLSCCFHMSHASQAAGTETLLAIVGRDFVLIGADSSVSQSIALTASNLDKIAVLVQPFLPRTNNAQQQQQPPRPPRRHLHWQQTIVAAAAGDAADSDRLIAMLQAHATIREYEASVGCDVDYRTLGRTTSNNNNNEEEPARVYYAEAGLTVEAMAHLARGQIAASLRSQSPTKVCLLIAGMMPVSQTIPSTTTGTTTTPTTPAFFAAERVQRQVQQAISTSTTRAKAREEGGVENDDVAPAQVASTESSSLSSSSSPAQQQQSKEQLVLEPRLYWLDEYGSIQQVQYGAHGHGSNFVLSILDQGFRTDMSREEATKLIRECFQQLRTRYVINSPQPPCIKCVDAANGCVLIR